MSNETAQVVDMTDPLAELRRQLEAEQKAAQVAKGALSERDREELELRSQIDAARAERERAEAEARGLDLSRRMDLARAEHPKAHLAPAVIDEYGDTFIVMHNASAFKRWQRGITESVTDKKFDREKNERDYVVASVIDWNGQDLTSPLSPGGELVEYLKSHPGVASTLAGVAGELAGVALNARKS